MIKKCLKGFCICGAITCSVLWALTFIQIARLNSWTWYEPNRAILYLELFLALAVSMLLVYFLKEFIDG